MARLVEHGDERHAPAVGQLLRYRNGRPITARRYDGPWARIGRVLPWVGTQQISMVGNPLPTSCSASRSPRPTQATKTAAGEQDPWPPWPPTSAPGYPK